MRSFKKWFQLELSKRCNRTGLRLRSLGREVGLGDDPEDCGDGQVATDSCGVGSGCGGSQPSR
jgi:hypothetical protein